MCLRPRGEKNEKRAGSRVEKGAGVWIEKAETVVAPRPSPRLFSPPLTSATSFWVSTSRMRGPKNRGASSSSFSKAMSKNIARRRRERHGFLFFHNASTARASCGRDAGPARGGWGSLEVGWDVGERGVELRRVVFFSSLPLCRRRFSSATTNKPALCPTFFYLARAVRRGLSVSAVQGHIKLAG